MPPRKKTSTWLKPLQCNVKMIDFGGATYAHESHTLIINTRQYRAPEVILENRSWDEKSDIWSMACIIAELYTGELFFDTHDNNLEHLAMIEKQCGPIPLRMAQSCHAQQIIPQLHMKGDREEESYVKNRGKRLRWPAAARS
jgi:serine/threonine protein kinase